MTTLTIRNLDSGETLDLARDAGTTHPDWVHAQMGTDSEAELQACLDGYDLAIMREHAGEPDVSGVYVAQGGGA